MCQFIFVTQADTLAGSLIIDSIAFRGAYMSQQFREQGGAATMDPSALTRWLTSKFIRKLIKPQRIIKQRLKVEKYRLAKGGQHIVEYFHQLDDGYSFLAAQVLQALCQRYDIELRCHLVTGPTGNNSVEPELLRQLSQYDANLIAPHYGLASLGDNQLPDQKTIQRAQSILAAQSSADFAALAVDVSAALWAGDKAMLSKLAEQYGSVSAQQCQEHVTAGNARRAELKHYSGAMFYYGGEWYWGIDRLHYLEQRLSELGVDRDPSVAKLMPRPKVESGQHKDCGNLTLEVYPSLRSPYTAIAFDQTLKLAEKTGVKLVVRPVLPMVMRGVPATREKGVYIFTDVAREARSAGVAFGDFYDPIGEPVRRCYSLYPWACKQGLGNQLLSSFLSCAFAKGINTNNDRGLKQVVEQAGLDWSVAKTMLGQTDWQAVVEDNRQAMYKAGLWGVPSYQLLNSQGESVLAVWGQDRLWLVAREIERQLLLGTDV
jgi:2-hydroxychromene-2-carboxylate isomerase